MQRDGKFLLRLVDAYGEFIRERVDITARNQTLADDRRFAAVDAGSELLLSDLIGPPNNRYLVEIGAPSYLPVRRFLSTSGGAPKEARTLPMPVNPDKVVTVLFPEFDALPASARALLTNSANVLGHQGAAGEELYRNLDNIRRAGFLNVIAKGDRTRLSNGRTVGSYFQEEPAELLEIRGDRFFVNVPHELREETKNSVPDRLFEPASAKLHKPPPGFSRAGSFKTPDSYGNLQLTFFARSGRWVADADLDEAAGLEHVFQVARNALTGRPTHPYHIHEILLIHQELDPGYRFLI
ncbi:MAG: hypothetical protein KIT09_20625 [Bryobacteraceae bacterium]|nr:hypothetical protein [Bryobacteraceae bacterium]